MWRLIFGFWPIFPIKKNPKTVNVPSGDQPAAQGLHHRMITIFPCGSRKSKRVHSGHGVFLWDLVGELGTPNLPKFLPMANGYTHAKCYYTAHQIWTKDVWKCSILRTDVLSHQISLPLPPKSQFVGPFNAKPKLHVNGGMKLKLYSYIGIGKHLGEWDVKIFLLGDIWGNRAP